MRPPGGSRNRPRTLIIAQMFAYVKQKISGGPSRSASGSPEPPAGAAGRGGAGENLPITGAVAGGGPGEGTHRPQENPSPGLRPLGPPPGRGRAASIARPQRRRRRAWQGPLPEAERVGAGGGRPEAPGPPEAGNRFLPGQPRAAAAGAAPAVEAEGAKPPQSGERAAGAAACGGSCEAARGRQPPLYLIFGHY
jgi:hypothetical protein